MIIARIIYNFIGKIKLRNIGVNHKIGKELGVTGGKYIVIGNNFVAGKGLRIEAIDKYIDQIFDPEIGIGNDCSFGPYTHIGCINRVIIGNNVLLGSNVLIIDHSHGDTKMVSELPPIKRNLISKGPIIINDGVWIGDKAIILPGVTIGENAIIGANSVITKNVPDNAVVVGTNNIIKIMKKN